MSSLATLSQEKGPANQLLFIGAAAGSGSSPSISGAAEATSLSFVLAAGRSSYRGALAVTVETSTDGGETWTTQATASFSESGSQTVDASGSWGDLLRVSWEVTGAANWNLTASAVGSSEPQGGGSVPSLLCVFSGTKTADANPGNVVQFDFSPGGGGSFVQQLGTDIVLHADGSTFDIMTDGQYEIEIDATVFPLTGSQGTANFSPKFVVGDNWITQSEGGTSDVYVDEPTYGDISKEFVRDFPPVPLSAGDRVGVQALYRVGPNDTGGPITFNALLTIVKVA